MNIEDINKHILKIDYNIKTHKYFWEIWINEKLLIKSTMEYDSERDCKIHLISLHLGFRYIYKNGDLKL